MIDASALCLRQFNLSIPTADLLAAAENRAYTENGESIFDWQKTGLQSWARWPVAALLGAPPFFGF